VTTLTRVDLWGKTPVDLAIARMREFEPPEGYYLAFSGGKDSLCLKVLADLAGVKYDAHYSLTTVDPPELVRYIREHHPDVAVDRPPLSMWELILKQRSAPTRRQRFCCEDLKETGGVGRMVLTGIRAEESSRRAGRPMVEACYKSRKHFLHAIIDWTAGDVWSFIRERNLPYCQLYDEGFRRVGCIMCPCKSSEERRTDAVRWPKYYQAYLRAFDRLVVLRRERNMSYNWDSGQALMDWWLSNSAQEPTEQMEMFA
jgi:phosphoadenosine phosphosulfate reductase